MRTILVLSGPNLSLTGRRQPEIYGTTTLDEIIERVRAVAAEHDLQLEHVAAESEGPLIEAIQAASESPSGSSERGGGRCAAIIINPGALTHYAWSLADALATFDGPVVEVHLSQPAGREAWRNTSVISPVATATISGLGPLGYELAVLAVARMHAMGREIS